MNTELTLNDQGRIVTAQIANVSYYVDTAGDRNISRRLFPARPSQPRRSTLAKVKEYLA
jgi:hypothetical protein